MEEIRERVYAVTFTPQARGKHRVFVYLNGMEVRRFCKEAAMANILPAGEGISLLPENWQGLQGGADYQS